MSLKLRILLFFTIIAFSTAALGAIFLPPRVIGPRPFMFDPGSGVEQGDALLLESGDYLLLENGDKLLLA